jgi:hypothetical protein
MAAGGLWNSFVFVAAARTLLDLYGRAQPRLLWQFLFRVRDRAGNLSGLESLYERLPTRDFSRDVLQRVAARLAVLPVSACGGAVAPALQG